MPAVPTNEPTETTVQAFDPSVENYTKYTDYSPVKAEPAEFTSSGSNVLVAYFSRSGNTAITAGVDAVSSASLEIQSDGTTVGNAERMAEWISEETGGDLFLIRTEYTYPVNYDQTVRVGEGQDRDGYRPVLISHVENMDQYDMVYLVFPIWHYTLPVQICSFLDEYDLQGKTIYVFTTHAGSRFANSLERIRTAEPEAEVIAGIAVSQNSIAESRQQIIDFIRESGKLPSE